MADGLQVVEAGVLCGSPEGCESSCLFLFLVYDTSFPEQVQLSYCCRKRGTCSVYPGVYVAVPVVIPM